MFEGIIKNKPKQWFSLTKGAKPQKKTALRKTGGRRKRGVAGDSQSILPQARARPSEGKEIDSRVRECIFRKKKGTQKGKLTTRLHPGKE